jgi:hypothetical protein
MYTKKKTEEDTSLQPLGYHTSPNNHCSNSVSQLMNLLEDNMHHFDYVDNMDTINCFTSAYNRFSALTGRGSDASAVLGGS